MDTYSLFNLEVVEQEVKSEVLMVVCSADWVFLLGIGDTNRRKVLSNEAFVKLRDGEHDGRTFVIELTVVLFCPREYPGYASNDFDATIGEPKADGDPKSNGINVSRNLLRNVRREKKIITRESARSG